MKKTSMSHSAVALGILAVALVVSIGRAGEAPVVGAAASRPVSPLTRTHAHNDYEHSRPLLDALDQGFCSIEADVYLIDGQLLVAHDRSKTSKERTLQALYLNPLRERVRRFEGRVYPGGPPCWLFIDLKTEAEATYAVLNTLLGEYQEMLTRFEGDRTTTNAVTVVVTGNRPRATIAAQGTRRVVYDGLLSDLETPVSNQLVPIISEQWTKHFQWNGRGPMSGPDATKLREVLQKAHAQKRLVRFWAAPDQAESWQAQFDAGVDLINTDNLPGIREFLLRQTRGATPAAAPASGRK